jgi:replicative DNA helicase
MKVKISDHLLQLEGLQHKEGQWPFVGLSSGFTVLDSRINFFRDGLYLIGGGAGVGKTTFVAQTLFQLIYSHAESYGVFLSLDMPYLDIVARLMALTSHLPVNKILNPRTCNDEEMEKREQGLRLMEKVQSRLEVMDQSHGIYDLKSLADYLEKLRDEQGDAPIFLAIDPVLALKTPGCTELRHKSEVIVEELKNMARRFRVGILLTANLDHAARRHRPSLEDIENYTGLIYGADLIGLLYNDSLNHFDTPFLEWEWGSENLMVPVVELNILKNKHHSSLGRIYFRFYNAETRYKECVDSENEHYNEMLGNLDYYGTEDRVKNKKDLKKKVYVTPE